MIDLSDPSYDIIRTGDFQVACRDKVEGAIWLLST